MGAEQQRSPPSGMAGNDAARARHPAASGMGCMEWVSGEVLIGGVPASLTPLGFQTGLWEVRLPQAGQQSFRLNVNNQSSGVRVDSITFMSQQR